MKKEYHITKKVMYRILAGYGGRRKYILSDKYTTEKKHQIVFTEKKNTNKWLSMTVSQGEVMVSLTDETGKIVKKDFYTEAGEPVTESEKE